MEAAVSAAKSFGHFAAFRGPAGLGGIIRTRTVPQVGGWRPDGAAQRLHAGPRPRPGAGGRRRSRAAGPLRLPALRRHVRTPLPHAAHTPSSRPAPPAQRSCRPGPARASETAPPAADPLALLERQGLVEHGLEQPPAGRGDGRHAVHGRHGQVRPAPRPALRLPLLQPHALRAHDWTAPHPRQPEELRRVGLDRGRGPPAVYDAAGQAGLRWLRLAPDWEVAPGPREAELHARRPWVQHQPRLPHGLRGPLQAHQRPGARQRHDHSGGRPLGERPASPGPRRDVQRAALHGARRRAHRVAPGGEGPVHVRRICRHARAGAGPGALRQYLPGQHPRVPPHLQRHGVGGG